jgi:hypothetical protein
MVLLLLPPVVYIHGISYRAPSTFDVAHHAVEGTGIVEQVSNGPGLPLECDCASPGTSSHHEPLHALTHPPWTFAIVQLAHLLMTYASSIYTRHFSMTPASSGYTHPPSDDLGVIYIYCANAGYETKPTSLGPTCLALFHVRHHLTSPLIMSTARGFEDSSSQQSSPLNATLARSDKSSIMSSLNPRSSPLG